MIQLAGRFGDNKRAVSKVHTWSFFSSNLTDLVTPVFIGAIFLSMIRDIHLTSISFFYVLSHSFFDYRLTSKKLIKIYKA